MEFLSLTCEEALFGGAAGGGKSDVLLMGALQYIDQPGYSGGIFRRTKVDLEMPDAILSRAHNWFAKAEEAGLCKWDDGNNTYSFLTRPGQPPATIHFGYVQHDGDLLRYQGSRFHFIGVDELTQWRENHFRYLFSRVRKLRHENIPLRVRASANPGGPGHGWVKARFIEHAKHITRGSDIRQDLRERITESKPLPKPPVYVSPPSPEAIAAARELGTEAEGAHFVPSFAADNPGLDLPTYNAQLAKLDPITQAWLRVGDWDALASGRFFNLKSFEYIEAEPGNVRWLRSWDFAATKQEANKDPDWTAGGKVGFVIDPNTKVQRFCIADMNRFREEPGPTEAMVVAQASKDGRKVSILMEQEPGSAGKTVVHGYTTRVLVGYQVIGIRKTGPKEEYWKPVSGFANAAPLLIVRGPWNKSFTEELTSLPVGHDDQADAISQGFAQLSDRGSGAERQRLIARAG